MAGSAEDTVLYPKMMDASSLENWPLNVPQSKPELDKVRDTLNEYADNGVTAVVDGDTSGIYTPGYLPHAVGINWPAPWACLTPGFIWPEGSAGWYSIV